MYICTQITTTKKIEIMTTLNLTSATKNEILNAAKQDAELMKFFGNEESIINREIECLRTLTEMYFILNTEVGCHFDNNGF